MPPATDKADPRGQFLNTFMFFTEARSHLFLLSAAPDVYTPETMGFLLSNGMCSAPDVELNNMRRRHAFTV